MLHRPEPPGGDGRCGSPEPRIKHIPSSTGAAEVLTVIFVPPRTIHLRAIGGMVALAAGAFCSPAVDCPVPPAPSPEIALHITIRPEPSAVPQHYYLECLNGKPTAETTVPTPEAACDDAAELGPDFFNRIPATRGVCAMIYGGPQEAWITGWIDGIWVNGDFSLRNGCEIQRWKTAENLLGPSNT